MSDTTQPKKLEKLKSILEPFPKLKETYLEEMNKLCNFLQENAPEDIATTPDGKKFSKKDAEIQSLRDFTKMMEQTIDISMKENVQVEDYIPIFNSIYDTSQTEVFKSLMEPDKISIIQDTCEQVITVIDSAKGQMDENETENPEV
jgi:hypothetical protein